MNNIEIRKILFAFDRKNIFFWFPCPGFDASINFWVDYTIQGKTNRAPTDRCIHPNVQCTWLNSSTMKDYFLRPGRSHRWFKLSISRDLKCARDARCADGKLFRKLFLNWKLIDPLCALIMEKKKTYSFGGINPTYVLRVRSSRMRYF